MVEFRKATIEDIDDISEIYNLIHTLEENHEIKVGWNRQIYPTKETARKAIECKDMFVETVDDMIVASCRINREQVPEYAEADWKYDAPEDKVMVCHTLTVHPDYERKGYAKALIGFYESYALENGCEYLRIDTNVINLRARKLYKALGYREASVVDCCFNGIKGVSLVCIEKKLNKMDS